MANEPYMRYKAGLGHVGSYQVSGLPWITGSTDLDNGQEHKILFPYVAKSVTIINKSAVDLRVHFNSTSSDGGAQVITGLHYITLTEDRDSISFNVKCKEIYISNGSGDANGSYEIAAELTTIETGNMYKLTGSGLTTVDGT
tara:strand:+ start:200 stop:625 length:426 start_codon:yes stop_codon:yes gene_type:complete